MATPGCLGKVCIPQPAGEWLLAVATVSVTICLHQLGNHKNVVDAAFFETDFT